MKNSPLKDTTSANDGGMRKRILGVAFKLFTENGYAGTSTLEIATRAKVSKRDLYALFESKQAMLLTCIQSRSPKRRLPTEMPLPRNRKDLASTLNSYATEFLTEMTHPSVIAMIRLAIAEANRSPEIAQALKERRVATHLSISEFLALVQSEGLLTVGDAGNMANQYIALLWDELLLSLLLGVKTKPNSAEIERRAFAATDAFLRIHRP
jgi:AcrR family transcriptional regulator